MAVNPMPVCLPPGQNDSLILCLPATPSVIELKSLVFNQGQVEVGLGRIFTHSRYGGNYDSNRIPALILISVELKVIMLTVVMERRRDNATHPGMLRVSLTPGFSPVKARWNT